MNHFRPRNICINTYTLDDFGHFVMTMKRLEPYRPFKILFIGDSAVGKTSLMFRFAGMQ